MTKKCVLVCILAVSTVALQGCPPPEGWPLPPFDTTGTYEGTWQGQTNEEEPAKQQEIAACPLSVTLEQDLTQNYPGDHGVKGTVTVHYDCIELPEWVQNQETPPPSEVPVSGILADDGKLTLASGGCGIGLCVLLTLAGEGFDDDGDGYMDYYEGTWSYIILLAGVQPFGVQGTYMVDAVEITPAE
mgnify:CR=1 FL=1